ncbi:MAG: RNase J family beta-CASP ribonuclease [Clostridiales bacterium]|nr:RNase J family beta-CASP ribonuclease [Clostridiales bacterium]
MEEEKKTQSKTRRFRKAAPKKSSVPLDGLSNLITIEQTQRDLSTIKTSNPPKTNPNQRKTQSDANVQNVDTKKVASLGNNSNVNRKPSASKRLARVNTSSSSSKDEAAKATTKSLPNVNTNKSATTTSLTNTKNATKTNPRTKNNKTKSPNIKQNENLKTNNIKAPVGAKSANKPRKSSSKQQRKTPVRIIPLGGLNEIGKNFTLVECANDIFIIDCGMAFPDAEMPGVDIVIPDFTYAEKNADKIKGIVITHGHEDHIGGIAYFLKKVNVPVYGTRLTIGLLEGKLKEHGLLNTAKLHVVTPKQTVKFGCMAVEFIRVNHSIPDATGLAVHTPAGVIVHTGDFKVDYTPIEGEMIDLARFAELGTKGVLALMSDSTNAERPGYTMTERRVGESFGKLFAGAEGKRIIIATFASNVHRIQQIINNAVQSERKVAISGRSMVNVIGKGIELGYLKCPEDIFIDIDLADRYPPEKVVLITTGSQGEPMSALTRMARNEHRKVSITSNDFIIISATPIPGNEKFVTKVVNQLMESGAEVVYEAMYDVHVSGHACQEELKLMLSLVNPKFFIPVHGEYKHLVHHKNLAMAVGIPEENIIIGSIGNVIESDGVDMKITGQVQAGHVLVDGLGVGDVGAIVLRDRKHLAQDGLIIAVATIDSKTGKILSGPDVVSRGFVYVRESEELMEQAKQLLTKSLQNCLDNNMREWNAIKTKMKDNLSDYIYVKTKRKPMILPIIMEV